MSDGRNFWCHEFLELLIEVKREMAIVVYCVIRNSTDLFRLKGAIDKEIE